LVAEHTSHEASAWRLAVNAPNDGTIGGQMNTDTLKGQWKQMQGEIKGRWGKFTDDELTQIEGNFDKLVGKLQEHYGYEREQAAREINDFLVKHPEPL